MTPVYKTLTGYAIHGHVLDLASVRALFADGHIPMLFKFFNCDAGYIAMLQDAFPTDTAFVVRYFERGGWHSNRSKEWLAAFPTPRSAAESYMNHFASDFALLAGIPRTVYVENFNEPSLDSPETIARICQFNVEVGKLLKSRYGEELKLAALSLASGNFNEIEMATLIADNLIRPLMASNVEFALSLHCYSSLAMPVWNEPYLGKADIQRIYREGNPAVEINLDAPIRIDLSMLPAAYTGFGHERLYCHLRDISIGGEDLHETAIMITESLIDDMQDPGIGASAGGYLEWERKDLLSRIKRPNESAGHFAGRNMIYAEKRYQAETKAGINLVGVTPFVYDDIENNRWKQDFALRGEPYDVFKDAMRIGGIEIPPPEEETMADKFILYWPTQYMSINQAFGTRPEYYGNLGHEGLDIAASLNSIISSCAVGVVKQVYLMNVSGYNAYGNHIRIEHTVTENDKTVVYETTYAHLIAVQVKVGDVVKAGQQIGLAGSTGNSTGPHLHLNLKRKGASAAGLTKRPDDLIDPTPYLVRDYAPTTCEAITTAPLRFRRTPSTANLENLIFTTEIGVKLTPTHRLAANGEEWYRVTIDGKTGWVASRFTTRAASCPVLPVWVEPTPEPEPVPTTHPDTVILQKIKPLLTRLRTDVVVVEADVQEILEVAGIELEV